jgi:hypothetical protein
MTNKNGTLCYSRRHRRIKATINQDKVLFQKFVAYYGKEEAVTQFNLFKLKLAVKSADKFGTK